MHYFHPLSITQNKSDSIYLQNEEDPFPPVNTDLFHSSAHKVKELTKQLGLLVGKIVNSPEFAYELMNAAQQSNKDEVDQLIKSIGITSKVKTRYNPTGIQVDFDNSELGGSCCHLSVSLHW